MLLLFHPHANMMFSSFELEVVHWLYWKECYRTGGNRMRDLIPDSIPTKAALFFCSDLSWNTCICYGHSLLPLQLQVSGRRMFSVLVNRLCISMPIRAYWDANFFPGTHKFHHAGVPFMHVFFFVGTHQKSRSWETNKQIKSALILSRRRRDPMSYCVDQSNNSDHV